MEPAATYPYRHVGGVRNLVSPAVLHALGMPRAGAGVAAVISKPASKAVRETSVGDLPDGVRLWVRAGLVLAERGDPVQRREGRIWGAPAEPARGGNVDGSTACLIDG